MSEVPLYTRAELLGCALAHTAITFESAVNPKP